jgi:ribosomal protein S18 acetylase RimI-like enzyme
MWQSFFRANGLEAYLAPKGKAPGIGPERGRVVADGISKYVSPHGSYRYVLSEGGRAVAALQVVSRDGEHGTIANVYVEPSYRRQGLASQLLRRAERDFSSIEHAEPGSRSPEAEAWIRGFR